MIKVEATQWEQMWLPLWPLATDDLGAGIYRMSRLKALGVRYIEANPQALSNLLVVDCDQADTKAVKTAGLPGAVFMTRS